MPSFEAIRHGSPIFALAISSDERLLACSGSAAGPITVWDLAHGMLVARLSGLPHQAQALAFSADSARLAAANIWGGLCVWAVADGRLLDAKPDTTSRKTRTLVYPTNVPPARWPMILSDSVSRPIQRALAPNGNFVAISQADVRVRSYRTPTEVARLDPRQYPVAHSGVRQQAWSADSRWLALSGAGWAGAWRPFDAQPAFYATALPFLEAVASFALLGAARQVLYAQGQMVAALELPEVPLPAALTPWQRFVSQRPPAEWQAEARTDWNWYVTQDGYAGVHTHSGRLVWYSHSYNPHAGGGAAEQAFQTFLETGPLLPLPETTLIEVMRPSGRWWRGWPPNT